MTDAQQAPRGSEVMTTEQYLKMTKIQRARWVIAASYGDLINLRNALPSPCDVLEYALVLWHDNIMSRVREHNERVRRERDDVN